MDNSLQILLLLALLVIVAKTLGGLSQRIGLPAVLGELLAGVILGPTVVGLWGLPVFSHPTSVAGSDPVSPAGIIKVLAQVGVVILMFLAGLETDTVAMKAALRPAFWAAFGGVVLPLVGGSLAGHAFGLSWSEAVFIGTVLTATSVSVTAQTLMNLRQLNSRAGTTILGAAVIDDVLGLIVLSLVIAAQPTSARAQGTAWVGTCEKFALMAAFFAVSFFAGPRAIRWVLRQARRISTPHAELALVLAMAFLLAFFAQTAGGVAAITGAYLAGLFLARTADGASVLEGTRTIVNAFFGPLFFASIGLEINARRLGAHWAFFLLILLVAVVGKVLGCGAGAWMKGFSLRDAMTVGVGMVPRGEVGLITASIGWFAGLIPQEVYTMVVILILATTILTPAFLRFCFPFERRRDGEPAKSAAIPSHDGEQVHVSTGCGPVACAFFVTLMLALVANTGCAMKKIAINKIGDAIASGGTVYATDNDPDLVREAVPFSLKLLESLLAESPRHRGLLLAASSGFTQYAYAFVQEDADEMESVDLEAARRMHLRARRLYLRSRDYGLRGLEVRHRGFGSALRENPRMAVRRSVSSKEVPLLYWTAASWGLAIAVSKDDPELVADQPIVEAMIDRALKLNPDFGEGAIHSFLISYEPSRQGTKGDPLERSRKHFERAVGLSKGKLAGPYVALAETVSIQKQDRAEFERLLKQALAVDPDTEPEARLANLVMQRRARWLLARTDELFAQ